MLCNYCNAEIQEQSDVCPICGRKTEQVTNSTRDKTSQPIVEDDESYPNDVWRTSWFAFLKICFYAAIIFAVTGLCVLLLFRVFNLEGDKLVVCGVPLPQILWGIAIAIPSLFWLCQTVMFLYNRYSQKYELSSNEIQNIKGIFSWTQSSVLLEYIWGMHLSQNVIKRLFCLGKITIFSADSNSSKMVISDIGAVKERFDKLLKYHTHAMDKSLIKSEKVELLADRPKNEVWRFSCRDWVDEFLWGIVITVCFIVLGFFIPQTFAYASWVRTGIMTVVPVCYWLWLIWNVINKIIFTWFEFTPSTLIRYSGIINKKIDVYVLYHLVDCEKSQNLWQWFFGVGNITLSVKWHKDENSEDVSKSKEDSTNSKESSKLTGDSNSIHKITFRGLPDFEKKYTMIKERKLQEGHQRHTPT